MRTLLLLPILFLFASCGTMSNLSEAIAKGRDIATDIKETYDDLKPLADDLIESGKDIAEDVRGAMKKYESIKDDLDDLQGELKDLNKEAFAKADKDGDGKLDWMERMAYLLALGGGSLEIGRRKLKQLKAKKDEAA